MYDPILKALFRRSNRIASIWTDGSSSRRLGIVVLTVVPSRIHLLIAGRQTRTPTSSALSDSPSTPYRRCAPARPLRRRGRRRNMRVRANRSSRPVLAEAEARAAGVPRPDTLSPALISRCSSRTRRYWATKMVPLGPAHLQYRLVGRVHRVGVLEATRDRGGLRGAGPDRERRITSGEPPPEPA